MKLVGASRPPASFVRVQCIIGAAERQEEGLGAKSRNKNPTESGITGAHCRAGTLGPARQTSQAIVPDFAA